MHMCAHFILYDYVEQVLNQWYLKMHCGLHTHFFVELGIVGNSVVEVQRLKNFLIIVIVIFV